MDSHNYFLILILGALLREVKPKDTNDFKGKMSHIGHNMRILAFSDWRIQNTEKLIEYIRVLDKKPDIIIYGGDDLERFNKLSDSDLLNLPDLFKDVYFKKFPSKNYFEELASLSKYGLLAIAGNDDLPFIVNTISGEKIFDIHKKPFLLERYVFVGIEGATMPPGILLHSEEDVLSKLNKIIEDYPDKEIIIVSHAPPFNILDVGIRFGIKHIGSVSLRKFIDKYHKHIKIVFCGHAHSQGGKKIIHNGITVLNCASHDNSGEPGKICIVDLLENIEIKWDFIYEWGVIQKEVEDLMKVPLVGHTRAEALLDMGVKNIEQLAKFDSGRDLSKYPCFLGGVLDLIRNYANAIVLNKPIIVRKHPFFEGKNNIYFFDAEYDPVGTKMGPVGIFLLGIMDIHGEAKQLFLDEPNGERKMLDEFRNWLIKESPILVSYSSTSADKPQLINAFVRFGIPTVELKNSFFDLYYDCIFTQKKKKQFIFLPMTGSMSAKEVSVLLGYKEPENMEISDGLQALIAYNQFLETKNKRIKEELLNYNKVDLERTKIIFDKINRLMDQF